MFVELILRKHEVGRVGSIRVASFKDDENNYMRLLSEAMGMIECYDRVLWMRVNSAFSWFVDSNIPSNGTAKIISRSKAFLFNKPKSFSFSRKCVIEFAALLVAWSTVAYVHRRSKKRFCRRRSVKDPRFYRIGSEYRERFIALATGV